MVWRDAQAQGIGLEFSIYSVADARFKATASGTVLTSTSQNGKSATFTAPSNLDPVSLAELSGWFLDLLETAKANLAAVGKPAPTDTELFNEMLGLMQPVYSATSDHSGV